MTFRNHNKIRKTYTFSASDNNKNKLTVIFPICMFIYLLFSSCAMCRRRFVSSVRFCGFWHFSYFNWFHFRWRWEGQNMWNYPHQASNSKYEYRIKWSSFHFHMSKNGRMKIIKHALKTDGVLRNGIKR